MMTMPLLKARFEKGLFLLGFIHGLIAAEPARFYKGVPISSIRERIYIKNTPLRGILSKLVSDGYLERIEHQGIIHFAPTGFYSSRRLADQPKVYS